MASATKAAQAVSTSKRNVGPNDFHYVLKDGAMVMQPGLGADQPDDLTMDRLRADAQAVLEKEEAVRRAAKQLAIEAEQIDARASDLDARQAEIDAREARLAELEAKLAAAGIDTSPNADPAQESRRALARQATDRA